MTTEAITSEALATIRAARGSDDRSIASACRLLNAVKLTVDQFDRALSAYDDAYVGMLEARDPDIWNKAEVALEAFCEREGLRPSDVAAQAILIRRHPIDEAKHDAGFDVKMEDPKLYEDCVTRTIHQGYFRFLTPDEIDADGEIIPLPS